MADAMQNSFELFVTCVDKIGPMLKIWGQTDRNNSMFIEQLLRSTSQQFETIPGIQNLSELSVGLLCCAKYKDGHYYRAQITNLRNLVSGSVEVIFIDYGNAELIGIENIRILNNVPTGLLQLKAQAMEFVLANIMHVHKNWDEKSLAFLHQEIAYMELRSTVVSALNSHRFVKITMENIDLADYIIGKGFAIQVPLEAQELWFRSKVMMPPRNGPFQQIAGAMAAPRPSYVSSPISQMHPEVLHTSMVPAPQMLCSYKTQPLPPNSDHMVYVSYVEDGPYLFSIQLQAHEEFLEKLMIEINSCSLLPLTEPPVPGYPCMARCLEDNSLCRAVVINMVEDKCKTYYVDFGYTDILPFTNIFLIPLKYVLPRVMSMRFTLAGLKKINVSNEMKCAFKEFVTNKLLRLKVLKLDSSPVMQYCELYDGDTNIIDILYETANEYKTIQITKGLKYNVIVSFITGCKKFFVQLKESSDALNNLMLALASTCDNSPNLQELHEGMPCVAFYSGDNQWYRAQTLSVTGNSVTVKYIDYGNEETVAQNYLKMVDPSFVKILPAQAIECCLCGYQNLSFNDEIESVFESLTLECEFSMKVINKQSNDTLLVDLFDASGNNVAALLIEKLAAQKSQISPLPLHQITKTLVNKKVVPQSPNSENSLQGSKSPARSPEKPSWRNPTSDNKSWNNGGNEKNSWRNTDNEKNSWRNTETSPPKFRNSRVNNRKVSHNKKRDNTSWNGDSPTNKRFTPRNERHERNNSKTDGKSNRYPDSRRSPRNDYGKGTTSFNSGSESEKSFGSRSGQKFGTKRDFKQNKPTDNSKNIESSARRKVELPPKNLAPFEEQFKRIELIPNASEQVAISWFYNPECFYCQILTTQKEFRDMMCDIQSSYNGRQPVVATLNVGASVIAEFPEDAILYRATILESKYPKYKVQYVDFGNVALVDANKIWQVEQKFMNIPMQAIKCGMADIKPANESWPVADVIDNMFNKESFTVCAQGFVEDKYTVQLYDNEVSIKQQLLDSGIAMDATLAFEMADEPIDSNILIGQNIYCHISFVHGLSKFFVHLEKEKAAQVKDFVNALMKSTNISTLQRFVPEQLEVGLTCLLKDNEESWHRGVITNTADPQALRIDYPDIGSSVQHSIDEIYILPPQLCVYWYQAFECSVHNLSSESNQLMTDEEFKQKYEGNDILIYVDELIENRLIVTLYETSGTKINLIEPDEGAYPTIEPLCPMPVLKSTTQVWVTHINNGSSVYLQRNSDSELIATLLERLYEYYDSNEELAELSAGDLCCAKSGLDGNWYRGRIENTTDDSYTVLYIDYGNTESVPKPNVRSLSPQFLNTHELALNVSLNLKELSVELTGKLTELTQEKLVKAIIFYAESGWLVDLFDGETSLNQTLIESNLAAPLEESVPRTAEVQDLEPKTDSVPVAEATDDETRAQIAITHIDSPSEFYVQLLANDKLITDLQADLQERIATLPDLEGADVGLLCAAKYSVDEQWYRAEVLDADADITTVRFVDYGNTDVINNNDGSIKTLPADLLAVDKYARKCSLNVKPAKGDEWPQDASELFESTVYTGTLLADIVYQDEKSKTFVDLFVDGRNVAEQLLKAQVAVAIVRDVEQSIANNTGFVSHLNSISEFWIQLESSVPDLEMIVDRLASADTFPDLQDLSPGILCAVNFPDDEMWYRARILSNTVAGLEVLFVDYGNSSTAMKLKVLPEDLVQMPILAQKCSLQRPGSVTVWSEQAVEKFRAISADGVTIFTIKKLTAGETSIVELFMDGRSIVDQLAELCEVSTGEERIMPVEEPSYEKVHITHVESPAYFWIQQSTDMEKIDEIMESLSAAGSFQPLTDYNPDTTCAALYTDSGLWYRAKILEFVDPYEVLLIDYGNTLCTSEIRALPADLESVPPLATLCSLQFPKDVTDWSVSACDKFATACSTGYTDCRAEFLDREFPSTVRLFTDGKSLAEDICSEATQDVKPREDTLKTETITLAENTPLPETDLDANDESFAMEEVEESQEHQTTIYEECDSTLKEDAMDHNTSFVSCADVTSTNLEVEITADSLDAVAHKLEDTEAILNDVSEKLDAMSDHNTDCEVHLQGTERNIDSTAAKLTTILDDDKSDVPSSVVTNSAEVLDDLNDQDVQKTSEDLITPTRSRSGSVDKAEISKSVEDEDVKLTDTVSSTEVPTIVESTSVTPQSERVVPDSASRTSVDEQPEPDITDSEVHDINNQVVSEKITEAIRSRSITPHSDRIVPGAVSRGDLEQVPPEETDCRPLTPHHDNIVPGSISSGDLEQVPVAKTPHKSDETNQDEATSRSVTPHCDKIVPGSISRGDLETPDEEIINRSTTPRSEKIVPEGVICTGDLEISADCEQLDEQKKNMADK